MQNTVKPAFTMIELIFVIVIIGILAAIAIPRLSATRTDALATKEAQDLSNYIGDIASYYLATGIVDANHSSVRLHCFDINISESVGSDRHITLEVRAGGPDNGENYCDAAQRMATKNSLMGSAHTVTFGGNLVSY